MKNKNDCDYLFLLKNKKRIKISTLLTALIGIFGAVIGLVGVVIGVFYTNWAQVALVDKQIRVQAEQIENEKTQQLINKRLDLIEQTAEIIGQAPGIDNLWKIYTKRNYYNENGEFVYFIDDKELAEKFAEYQGRYQKLFLLAGCYFGNRTIEAMEDLNNDDKEFWRKSTSTTSKLLTSMVSEINIKTTGTLGYDFCVVEN